MIVRNGEFYETKKPIKIELLRTLTYTDYILMCVLPFTGDIDNPAAEATIPAEWIYLFSDKSSPLLLLFVILTDSNLVPVPLKMAKSSHLCYTTRQYSKAKEGGMEPWQKALTGKILRTLTNKH